MRAAVLHEYGHVPTFDEFREPTTGPGEVAVEVAASALHHVDRIKASGTFYLSRPELPSVVGSDGVGRLADGRRVYFESVIQPFGAMGQRALVREDELFDVPDGIDDASAAALGNTGMAAWLALSWRARLQPGETVLVLGAAGALGSIARQAARLMGAARVVCVDHAAALHRIDGADTLVSVDGNADLAAALRDACAGGADVIVDAVWGQPAVAAMQAARHGARFVQLGQAASASVDLPASALRAARLDLLGFAYVHAPLDVRRTAYQELAEAVRNGKIRVHFELVPLSEISDAWERQARGPETKLVVEIG